MKVIWSPRSLADLARLYEFRESSTPAAAAAVDALLAAVDRLVAFPRLGERVPRSRQREMRRLVVGAFEIRYEVKADEIVIARIYSTRAQR